MAFVLAVGWSRIAQGLHFPADIVMGWIIGLSCAAIARRIVVPFEPLQHRLLQLSRERLSGFIRVSSEPQGPSPYGWWTLG
ncbi:MAG TPA: phosphatase PAP2 family protein, partial [Rhodocyclaceae bacterium]|nr:phosphatase PAP2 family protein [Rhodocyclaceae bacterium]